MDGISELSELGVADQRRDGSAVDDVINVDAARTFPEKEFRVKCHSSSLSPLLLSTAFVQIVLNVGSAGCLLTSIEVC